MAVPVQVDLNANTKKVEAALARIKAQAKGINFGGGAESINKLSRPLGKITGQASEFQKSLEASNARVLAFGASVAVINKLSEAFGALVNNTIKVEASFAKINTILGGTQKQLEQFGNGIFKVAQQTGTSFDEVAEGALELARQGLSVEESLSRVSTALKLVRVSGIDAEKAVGGLTAAIKGFEGAGLTVAQIADKLAEVDTKFAVSTEDLINGLERASASARVAGVSFDELLGVVTTVQERTQRGGAVIGNAFKTIFARLGRSDTLIALQDLGISVLDAEGNVRGAIPLFEELAVELNKIGLKSVEAGNIIQKVAGVRQRDILISLIEDLNSGQSQFAKSLQVSAGAAGALDAKNSQLNQTLESLINNLTVGSQKLASVLGDLGFTDAAGDILKAISSIVNGITDILQGEGIGAKFAQGLVKGVGSVLTGPGLALISAIFIKLFIDLAKFGATSLKQILGINKAAAQQATLQQSVLQTLLQNENIQKEILALEGNKVAQEKLLLRIYNEQAAALARVQKAAATVTPGLFGAGLRGGEGGVKPRGKASGGYIAAEARDVSRGVGGAPANSRVVSIPNFAFGGGKRGTMVANTSEYIVPNFAGGGDAIFNRDMVRSMGLPAGARKINAAGGFIPNFASAAKMSAAFNRMSGPEFVSRFGQAEFNLRQRAAATGITASERKKEADAIRKRRASGPAAGAITKKKSQARSLELIANKQIGIASLFPESPATSTTTTKLSRDDLAALKTKGYSNVKSVTLTDIQNKSLRDYQKNKKSAEANLRKRLVDFFTEPLIQFGNRIVSEDFKNDEAASIRKKLLDKKRDPNLFSTAVQGGILESAIRLVTQGVAGIKDFKDNKGDGAAFDFEEVGDAAEPFRKAFGFSEYLIKADAKRTANSDAIRSLIGKTLRDKGAFAAVKKVGRGSNGYIPNFAGGALEEAIGREQAAGLPINQIRINQSGKLRNAQNPMGLAVTNTRDEPTGAIPNFKQVESFKSSGVGGGFMSGIRNFFASAFGKNTYPIGVGTRFAPGGGRQRDAGSASGSDDGLEKTSGALDGAITKIFALQLATSALTSTFTEQDSVMARFGEAASTAINTLLVLSTTGLSPLGVFGKRGEGLKGLGGLIKGAKTAGGALKLLKGLAGPVALGFTAIDVALKTFTGKGVFQRVGEGLGLVATEAEKTSRKFNEVTNSLNDVNPGKGVVENLTSIGAKIEKNLREQEAANKAGAKQENLVEGAVRGTKVLESALGVEGAGLGQFFGGEKVERSFEVTRRGTTYTRTRKLGKDASESIQDILSTSLFASVEEIEKYFSEEGTPITAESAQNIFDTQKKAFDRFNESLITEVFSGGNNKDDIIKIIENFRRALVDNLDNAVETLDVKKFVEQGIKEGTIFSQTRARGQIQGIGLAQSESIRAGLLEDTKENRKKLGTGGFATELEKVNAQISIKERKNQAEIATKTLQLNQKIREQLIEQSEISGRIAGISEDDFNNKVRTFDIEKLAGKERADLLKAASELGFQSTESQEKFIQIVQNGTTELEDREQQLKDELAIEKSIAQTNAERADEEKRINQELKKSLRTMQQQAQLESIRKNAEKERLSLILNDPTVAFSNKYLREIEYNKELAEIGEARVQSAEKLEELNTELAALEKLRDNASEKEKQAAQELVNAKQDEVNRAKENNTELQKTLDLREKIAKKTKEGTALDQANAQRRKDLKNLEETVPERLADNLESSLGTAFNNIATGAYDSLGNVMLQVALDFGQAIQKELANAAAKQLVQGITSSSGGGGFFNFIGSAFKGLGKNSGGLITGGSGVRDDIPAVLTGGEYVIKKSAVQKYGVDFLDRLNSKGISQMQSGGFFVPGTRGQGAIKGKENLLAFANQEFTSGATDIITSSGSGAFIDLEDQSARLSTFGRFRESPARRALKDAQNQALGLYNQQIEEERRIREAEKQRSRQLKSGIFGSFLSAGIYGGVSGLGGIFNRGITPPTPSTSLNSPTTFSGSSGYNLYGSSFGFANGGMVSGGSNALLMGGEYVMSASAASQIGRGNLDNINMMNFSNGGGVGNVASSSGETTSADIGEVSITINMEKGDATVENSSKEGGDITQTKEFAKKIKDVVVGVINEEKRVSGSLFSRRK